ncbi:hypothetical protein [Rhizobium sp. Leaf386]|uniref:hypothetical protein n=1 Tax=Rhizobium sp. Leaf386 TaxID=1736359 RepID=UPI000715AC7C|nr:hypothetical protein [Rhizobium sp. Leaf386]KQS90292.1 hypothetical protein ASG50_07495 [Rhizobium sp. Leaf386]
MSDKTEIVAGFPVVLKTGSPAMNCDRVQGGKAWCSWQTRAGEIVEETHNVGDLVRYDGKNAVPEPQTDELE